MADDSEGIALHIHGPRFHQAVSTDDIPDVSTIWVGGDGTEYTSAWLRDLVIFNVADTPQEMVALTDPVPIADKLPGYIMAIAAGGKVDTMAEMVAELVQYDPIVGVQKRFHSSAEPEGSSPTSLPADFNNDRLRETHFREIQLLSSQLNNIGKPYFFFQNFLRAPNPGDGHLDDIANGMRPYRAIFAGPDMFPDDSTHPKAGAVINRVKPRYQLFQDGTLWKAGSWQNDSHMSTTDDTATHPLGFHTMEVMFDEAIAGFHVETIFINTWNGGMNKWEGAAPPYTNSADIVDDPSKQPPFQP